MLSIHTTYVHQGYVAVQGFKAVYCSIHPVQCTFYLMKLLLMRFDIFVHVFWFIAAIEVHLLSFSVFFIEANWVAYSRECLSLSFLIKKERPFLLEMDVQNI